MRDYYAQRAKTYESIYAKPERQGDLAELSERISEALTGRKVLEVACGTAYWTERFAEDAESVLATDINQNMLDIANAKRIAPGKVSFAIADAFDLPKGDYNACFAGFWWSHVKKEEQADFLKKLQSRVGKDCVLVLIDNNHVEGSSLPIARTDSEGNTYQLRLQEDGSRVEIVKNFPTDSFMRKKFATFARDIRIHRNEYFWMLTCVLR
ncbi:class I SAM-dependent methyltransferase [Undibacterium sp. Jales W-56]|uniref:class I SAM-dependent methyltransferase n=1 Tax=Undibacterium sp. Jales W-56 TaxID=2897325 RepID=UPI0021D0AF4F|nr:class I SAM-dependent methyltransferase [Undibacterium sp. Jales W-56]MCU6433554.1 class I SAM-dependent methyltransferase [Undibacterium sp. Jales W-56]